jgi:hypothetical protein
MSDARINESAALMQDFAERTGLVTGYPQRRYLWTDAFAVCNFFGLARATGEHRYAELALRLIDQVHHTLGQYRDDDQRHGWISGLSMAEGEAHPTRGGLRIGKALPERGPEEPFDERVEWDRDGQYFHYLTKWMLALDEAARATRQPQFNRWARELAETAFRAFSYLPSTGWGPRRMYWKMSVDLTRAQVSSMGQHDPLDGYVTTVQLRATAAALPGAGGAPDLADESGAYAAMIKRGEWSTADPLGLGGLLTDAYRVAQLMRQGALPDAQADTQLLDNLLGAALMGLQYYAHAGETQLPAEHRLAFRELGLAIGLHAVQRMWQATSSGAARPYTGRVRTQLQALLPYAQLGDDIETFWRAPARRRTDSWTEHRDINEVMLATSLAPEGFLVLLPAR